MTDQEARAWMFLAAAVVIFYDPIAKPLSRWLRRAGFWLWDQRPGKAEREKERKRIERFRMVERF